MNPKVIAIDLDGTICTEQRTFEREFAQPLADSIRVIRRLYSEGNTIIIWTARGWEQFKSTTSWLMLHDIPYHSLLMGKPIVDIWIDDRALRFSNWRSVEIELLDNH